MKTLVIFVSVTLFLTFPVSVSAEIIVHDIVISTGKEVMLRAEVKGKLFHKGGELVEFFVNEQYIGKSLSGGDGFAFKQFVPSVAGMYQIKVKSGNDEGRGLLLSLKKGTRIIFVDIEGCLVEKFSNKPKQGSQKVIQNFQRRFPVVLLHTAGFLNIRSIKEWLKNNGFPVLPVILWKQGAVFDDLYDGGFKIKAVIGSPDIINSAKEYKPLAFSFEKTDGAEEVKDWEEIGKKM